MMQTNLRCHLDALSANEKISFAQSLAATRTVANIDLLEAEIDFESSDDSHAP